MGWSSKASLKKRYVKADLEKVMKRNESVQKARGAGSAWYHTCSICPRKSKEIKLPGMELETKKSLTVEV